MRSVVALAVGLAGCRGVLDDPCTGGGDRSLVLGDVTDAGVVPWDLGQEVLVVDHDGDLAIVVGMDITGLDARGLVAVEMEFAGETRVYPDQIMQCAQGVSFLGLFATAPEANAKDLVGLTAELLVTLTDVNGVSVSAETEVGFDTSEVTQ